MMAFDRHSAVAAATVPAPTPLGPERAAPEDLTLDPHGLLATTDGARHLLIAVPADGHEEIMTTPL
jgi:hypothetical protein